MAAPDPAPPITSNDPEVLQAALDPLGNDHDRETVAYRHAFTRRLERAQAFEAERRTQAPYWQQLCSGRAKRRAIDGVLLPMSARENQHLLEAVGFVDVERVWRCLQCNGQLIAGQQQGRSESSLGGYRLGPMTTCRVADDRQQDAT